MAVDRCPLLLTEIKGREVLVGSEGVDLPVVYRSDCQSSKREGGSVNFSLDEKKFYVYICIYGFNNIGMGDHGTISSIF